MQTPEHANTGTDKRRNRQERSTRNPEADKCGARKRREHANAGTDKSEACETREQTNAGADKRREHANAGSMQELRRRQKIAAKSWRSAPFSYLCLRNKPTKNSSAYEMVHPLPAQLRELQRPRTPQGVLVLRALHLHLLDCGPTARPAHLRPERHAHLGSVRSCHAAAAARRPGPPPARHEPCGCWDTTSSRFCGREFSSSGA